MQCCQNPLSKADFLMAYSVLGLGQCLTFTNRGKHFLKGLASGCMIFDTLLQGIALSVPSLSPPQKGSAIRAVL